MINLSKLKDKILILDGAIGTSLESYKIEKSKYKNFNYCNEVLNITNPEIVKEMHRKYIVAGADIIETNTFNCNMLTLGSSDIKGENAVYEICKKGCNLAIQVKKEFYPRKTYVAGSVGPTFISLTMTTKDNYFQEREKLKNIYYNQLKGIVESEIDFLLIETVFDKLNLQVALESYFKIKDEKKVEIPVIISFAINEKGKIYSGEDVVDIIKEIDCENIIGYGFNCCKIGKELITSLEKLKGATDKLVICYPNAGVPDEKGVYPITLEMMKEFYKEIIEKKLVNIVGGCCGTTFKEIEILKKLVESRDK